MISLESIYRASNRAQKFFVFIPVKLKACLLVTIHQKRKDYYCQHYIDYMVPLKKRSL